MSSQENKNHEKVVSGCAPSRAAVTILIRSRYQNAVPPENPATSSDRSLLSSDLSPGTWLLVCGNSETQHVANSIQARGFIPYPKSSAHSAAREAVTAGCFVRDFHPLSIQDE